MAVPIIGILTFAGFVIAGVAARWRSDIHRPMMLLATLAAMPAAISRIDFLSALYRSTVWETVFGPFLGMLVIGALLPVGRWLLTRSFDRWYAAGYTILAASCVLTMQLATTGARARFASYLLR